MAHSTPPDTDSKSRMRSDSDSMVAQFESDLIRLRTCEGIRVAKAKGRLRGKQPKLNRRQEAQLVSLVHSGDFSTAELFSLGRSTVYRAIERQRTEARAVPARRVATGGSCGRPVGRAVAGAAGYQRVRRGVPTMMQPPGTGTILKLISSS